MDKYVYAADHVVVMKNNRLDICNKDGEVMQDPFSARIAEAISVDQWRKNLLVRVYDSGVRTNSEAAVRIAKDGGFLPNPDPTKPAEERFKPLREEYTKDPAAMQTKIFQSSLHADQKTFLIDYLAHQHDLVHHEMEAATTRQIMDRAAGSENGKQFAEDFKKDPAGTILTSLARPNAICGIALMLLGSLFGKSTFGHMLMLLGGSVAGLDIAKTTGM